ncbi:twin-arginine translocase subunit TatC [Paenibacillus sp. NEAU-GSW1]|uniref:twin-arginine translocase subunit TatC n=1 Tax=Paenibacillus sp. NEAU-GSW1 TaxID=2682486 RepID=UPI0012E28E54|nr:twin-arginine translocase subunit TatC [Paenibacillus sp. NEAU-GSW1]MUT67799.1 twin-arginine translocase subunit TatC [Paenibacillus sp. NEAU-GSW1]
MDMQQDVILHLTELRKRLIYVAAWFLGALCLGIYFSPYLLRFIQSNLGSLNVQWSVFALSDGLLVYMKIAMLFGFAVTLPFLLYHLWAFAKPGLTEREAKGALWFVPASACLFLTGVLFGYTVALPMMVRFMIKLNHAIGANEVYGLQHFISFLFSFLFPMGIAFEMPLVMLFLTLIGILTPGRVKFVRKYAYVALAVVGTCISPPDFVSHLSVTVPLILLFEISVFVSWRYTVRKRKKLADGTSGGAGPLPNPNPS